MTAFFGEEYSQKALSCIGGGLDRLRDLVKDQSAGREAIVVTALGCYGLVDPRGQISGKCPEIDCQQSFDINSTRQTLIRKGACALALTVQAEATQTLRTADVNQTAEWFAEQSHIQPAPVIEPIL